MTYDITTLMGSLDECADRMANNLTAKGVTASFNEDLLTLANKINNISDGIDLSNYSAVFWDKCTGDNNVWDYINGTYSHNSNVLNGSANFRLGHSINNPPSEIIFEYDYYTNYSWNWQYTIFYDANRAEINRCLASSSSDVGSGILTCKSIGYNKWVHLKVNFKENGEAKMWINDVLKASTNNHGLTWNNIKYIALGNSGNSSYRYQYKNILLTLQ